MEAIEDLIIKTYHTLDRRLFLDDLKDLAWVDSPLPIGYGQTISQPSLVLQMTLNLKPFLGCRVLEIGTGSGYQTALLACFAETVYTVERLEPLHTNAEKRLEAMGYTNIRHRLGDGWEGWPAHAPYDRIIVTAAAAAVPEALLAQLAPAGIMIIPIGAEGTVQELIRLERDDQGGFQRTVLEYVRFVPLVKGNS